MLNFTYITFIWNKEGEEKKGWKGYINTAL